MTAVKWECAGRRVTKVRGHSGADPVKAAQEPCMLAAHASSELHLGHFPSKCLERK